MRKLLKKSLCLLMALVMLTGLTGVCFAENTVELTRENFLKVEGDRMFNARGEEVVLRGTNFGGWGIMEDWFCPFTGSAGEEDAYNKLVERFGIEKTHELFKTYRENWITEVDYRNVADLGMNCVRLPIWFRNLQSDDKGTWYTDENGEIDFSELDEVAGLCKKYGLYLIIDLHGLPGYQNDYDHCGRSKSMSLFDDTEQAAKYRDTVVDFWVKLAEHFRGDSTIAMYDLMNEPLGTNITVKQSQRQAFWDFSDRLYREIRRVDPDHIISMEAIWSPDAMASPSVYGWKNIVYQEHLYDISDIAMLAKVNEIKNAKYNAPFYIGEFYPRGFASFGFMLSLFNKRKLSWTTWTYKGAGDSADNSPWFLYGSDKIEKIDYENDSYETLMQKWGECLRTDSGNFEKTAFASYVSNFTDGYVDNVMLYSMGNIDTTGSVKERFSLFKDKLKAIYTTILDWIRKLRTGDLL